MARKSSFSGKQAALKNLRVQLIPVEKDLADTKTNREMVQKLIGLMVSNLQKRGRPKKDQKEELAHAL